MKLLVVATGDLGSGKSHALARLAAVIPNALFFEEVPYRDSDQRHLYHPVQHIFGGFTIKRGAEGVELALTSSAHERCRGTEVILLAAREQAEQKIAAIIEASPRDVVYASSTPRPFVTPTWMHHGNGDGLNLAR